MATIPTIHLNGTCAKELIAGYEAAILAIGHAIKALNDCAPNGRDYYPQGTENYPQASTEHRARVLQLRQMKTDLYEVIEGIWDQEDTRS